jgi:hypothetical protein
MDMLVLFLLAALLLAASYAGFLFWTWFLRLWNNSKENTARLVSAFILMLAFIAVVMPVSVGSVYAQSAIDFDLSPFFDSLNTYLPIFIGIFAVVGGIAGAIALARYVIGAVVRAFAGGKI